jgi:hypothetical protein
MPVASVLRRVERDHDFVSLSRADLVVAARTAVRLVSLVRLHVANIDARVVGARFVGPFVPGHHDRAGRGAPQVTTPDRRSGTRRTVDGDSGIPTRTR